MYSQNSSSGDTSSSIFFDIGTDIDMAQINVQNSVNMALPTLPEEVKRTGITIRKQSLELFINYCHSISKWSL